MTPCVLVSGYQILEATYCLHFLSTLSLYFGNGDSKIPNTPVSFHQNTVVIDCARRTLAGTRAAASAVLLFLYVAALTARLTNLTGHRTKRHAQRVHSRDGDALPLSRLHYLYQKDEGAKPGNLPI